MSDSQKFPVAAHALAYLAHKGAYGPEAAAPSAVLAASVPTNPVVVRRVTALLAKAGLIATRPGASGGAVVVPCTAEADAELADPPSQAPIDSTSPATSTSPRGWRSLLLLVRLTRLSSLSPQPIGAPRGRRESSSGSFTQTSRTDRAFHRGRSQELEVLVGQGAACSTS